MFDLLRNLFFGAASGENVDRQLPPSPPVFPAIRYHADPFLDQLEKDRRRKNGLANEFLAHVNRRLSEGNVSGAELRSLFARLQTPQNVCTPDEHPYDPMGRRVYAAISFNGSMALGVVQSSLEAYYREHYAAPAPSVAFT